MNTPKRFTEADLRRALRAAAKTGPDYDVEVCLDGTIRITRQREDRRAPPAPIEDTGRVVLW